jgi:hypothetical protein
VVIITRRSRSSRSRLFLFDTGYRGQGAVCLTITILSLVRRRNLVLSVAFLLHHLPVVVVVVIIFSNKLSLLAQEEMKFSLFLLVGQTLSRRLLQSIMGKQKGGRIDPWGTSSSSSILVVVVLACRRQKEWQR